MLKLAVILVLLAISVLVSLGILVILFSVWDLEPLLRTVGWLATRE